MANVACGSEYRRLVINEGECRTKMTGTDQMTVMDSADSLEARDRRAGIEHRCRRLWSLREIEPVGVDLVVRKC